VYGFAGVQTTWKRRRTLGLNPSWPGETLVLYTFGLIRRQEADSASRISSTFTPPYVPSPLMVTLNVTPNAAPARLGPTSATVTFDQAIFAGLTQGWPACTK